MAYEIKYNKLSIKIHYRILSTNLPSTTNCIITCLHVYSINSISSAEWTVFTAVHCNDDLNLDLSFSSAYSTKGSQLPPGSPVDCQIRNLFPVNLSSFGVNIDWLLPICTRSARTSSAIYRFPVGSLSQKYGIACTSAYERNSAL